MGFRMGLDAHLQCSLCGRLYRRSRGEDGAIEAVPPVELAPEGLDDQMLVTFEFEGPCPGCEEPGPGDGERMTG